MDVSVTTFSHTTENPLAAKTRSALQRAISNDGKLPPEVLGLQGMSGQKYRLFINNLIGSLEDARYLEVGVWMGSTLCSAIYSNKARALAIDNWSQFGGPATEFLMNLSRFKTADAHVSFLHNDYRAVNFATVGRFNVYLFDGPHRLEDQRDGITLALPALDERCVLIVDDWNWQAVRQGTMDAIAAAEITIDYMAEIRTTQDETHGTTVGGKSDWHNGYFVAAVTKAAGS